MPWSRSDQKGNLIRASSTFLFLPRGRLNISACLLQLANSIIGAVLHGKQANTRSIDQAKESVWPRDEFGNFAGIHRLCNLLEIMLLSEMKSAEDLSPMSSGGILVGTICLILRCMMMR
jgi:hypothetical protein